MLAASQTRDKDALTKEGVRRVLDELVADGFDYIVCDSPAGIEKGAHLAMYFADRAIVVVNPEVSSVRDSDRILGLLASKTQRAENGESVKEHLLLTRYSPRRVATGEMMSVERRGGDPRPRRDRRDPGIPRRARRLERRHAGDPERGERRRRTPTTTRSRACSARRVPLRFIEEPKKGFLARMFGG